MTATLSAPTGAAPRVDNRGRLLTGVLALALVLVAVCLLSITMGSRAITLGTVWDAIFDPGADSVAQTVVREIRVPRTLLGVIVGVALGLSGTILQGVTRNPLADPGIMGINAGAAAAIVASVMLFGATGLSTYVWFSFLGAGAATLAVYSIASFGREGATPVKLALAGAAITAGLTSVTSTIVITQVDAAPVSTDTQLQREILKKKVGQNVELTVWRKGQTLKIPVTTGELPNDISRASNELTPPVQPKPEDSNKFGLQVQDLTKEVAARLKLSVEQGVIVTDVAENSLAAAQDIQREDVITEVDGKRVTNVASFREALTKADLRKGILLYLDRKGSKTFAVLKAAR